jgi:predicted PurR-regulated permease PerM
VPPVLLALLSNPVLALWVALAYTAIQQVESQVIQPLVMSRAVALHPAVLLFGLLFMGSLFGIVGLPLAVPLVATVQVLVRELWVRRMDGAGSDPDPPARERRENPVRRLQRLLRNLGRPRQKGRGR